MDRINVYVKPLYDVPKEYSKPFSHLALNQRDGSAYFYLSDEIKNFFILFGNRNEKEYYLDFYFTQPLEENFDKYNDRYDRTYLKIFSRNDLKGKEV